MLLLKERDMLKVTNHEVEIEALNFIITGYIYETLIETYKEDHRK